MKRRWITGIIYFLTGAVLGIGHICDFWTLNTQVSLINRGEWGCEGKKETIKEAGHYG